MPRPRAAVSFAATALLAGQAAAQTIIDLGVLPGTLRSRGTAISADGQSAAGFCYDIDFYGGRKAFRWTATGGMEDLGFAPSWTSADALAISGHGAVVAGYSGSLVASNYAAFRWTSGGGIQTLSPATSIARGVDGDGSTIVGSSGGMACRWASAGLQLLGGGTTDAFAVSDDGTVIVGKASNSQAFRWTAAGVQYLGAIAGSS